MHRACSTVPNIGHSLGLSLPRSTSPARHSAGSVALDVSADRSAAQRRNRRTPRGWRGRSPESPRCRATCAVGNTEDLPNQFACGDVALALRPRARTGSPRVASPFSSCCTASSIPSRMSTGSKPVTTMGTWYRSAIGSYSSHPITVQTCPAARKPCTRLSGATRIATIAGGTRDVRDQHGEVAHA